MKFIFFLLRSAVRHDPEMEEIKYYIFTVFDDGHSITLLLSLYSFTL